MKRDLVEAEAIKDRYKKVIFAFNVKGLENDKIPVFQSDVIYTLFEEYDNWVVEERDRERKEKLAKITLPAKIKLLKGFVFHQKDPCVVGVEIIEGTLKSGVRVKKGKKIIGEVKQIQKDNENVGEAQTGERAAVSIEGGVVGRNIKEGDELLVVIGKKDLKLLGELGMDVKLAKESLG